MPKKLSQREEQLICKQYADNWTLNKISSYADVSFNTTLSVLRRNGIELKGRRKTSDEKEHDVVSLYNKGESILSIIDKTGVRSEQTIYRILRDSGVVRRRNTVKAAD